MRYVLEGKESRHCTHGAYGAEYWHATKHGRLIGHLLLACTCRDSSCWWTQHVADD
jgi:hypothetical protein